LLCREGAKARFAAPTDGRSGDRVVKIAAAERALDRQGKGGGRDARLYGLGKKVVDARHGINPWSLAPWNCSLFFIKMG
jgi:hypothetical protein